MNQNFLKEKKQTFVYFLTTNAHLSQRPSVYKANMQIKSNTIYKKR